MKRNVIESFVIAVVLTALSYGQRAKDKVAWAHEILDLYEGVDLN